MLIISHHSQWVLTMGCSFFLCMLSSFAPPAPPYASVVSAFLRVIPGFWANIYLGFTVSLCLFFGIVFRALSLAACGQLTVRAPLLSIWEVARSQLEHVSLGLLELLPHNYDDDNEDGQQDQNAANGHCNHGAVTHLACELCCSCSFSA